MTDKPTPPRISRIGILVSIFFARYFCAGTIWGRVVVAAGHRVGTFLEGRS